MKSWLGLVGLTAMISACSAAGSDAASATNADTANSPTAPSWDPDYQVFETRADAEAFIAQHIDDMFGDKPLPADDARSLRAQAALDKHWPAIVAKFHPNYPEPHVFVVDDDKTVNAMAMFNWQTDQAMNIIYVYSGILKFSDDDLEVTLLHETGHLTMKNGISRYDEALTKYYRAPSTVNEGVGLDMANDVTIQTLTMPYFGRNNISGADPEALDGLPGTGSFIDYFFGQYQQAHLDASNPDCGAMQAQIATAITTARAARNPFDGMYRLDDAAAATVSQASALAEQLALTCMKPAADVDLDQAMFDLTSQPKGSIGMFLGADDAATFAGKDALTGMFALNRAVHAQQRAFEARPDYAQLRMYTGEEQADDFALTMLAAEGIDFGKMRTMFFDYIEGSSESYYQQCQTVVLAGSVPAYDLTEVHHGNCYRAYHVGQFEKYVAAGGGGVVIPNIPKPAVTAMMAKKASPADRKPWKNSTL